MDPVRPNAVLRPIATDVGKCPDAAGPGEARHHRGDEGRTARPRPPVIRVGVSGAAGRMRRALLQTVEAAPGICHGALWERPGHPSHGSDLNGRTVAADLGAAAQDVDVVFDFTSPDALFRHLEVAARAGLVIVVGTTGLQASHHSALDAAAKEIPVLQAPNMSLGVNALIALVAQEARYVGTGFDLEIVEAHHRGKDAPSGTALALLEALQAVRESSRSRLRATWRYRRPDAWRHRGSNAARRRRRWGAHCLLLRRRRAS